MAYHQRNALLLGYLAPAQIVDLADALGTGGTLSREGEAMSQPMMHIVPFYEDEVRSYCTPDGRQFVILRDPFLRLGLNPNQQVERMRRNPLYEGFLEQVPIIVIAGMGLQRTVMMDALDLEMMPMC